MRRRRSSQIIAAVVALVVVVVSHKLGILDWTDGQSAPVASGPRAGPGQVVEAFRARRSGVVVECAATVERILGDDVEPPRHQRFIARIHDDLTVLVAHNIDLAPRAPVAAGATILLKGEYEWNEQGGVVHWTHRDPQNRRSGGWIEVDGRRYE